MGWRNPDDLSEFEVHSEAFIRLKKVFRNVRGEYFFKKDGCRAGIFDIAILDDNKNVLLVIEVKARKNSKSWHQAAKYGTMTGKPVLYLRGLQECQTVIYIVEKWLIDSSRGRSYLPRHSDKL